MATRGVRDAGSAHAAAVAREAERLAARGFHPHDIAAALNVDPRALPADLATRKRDERVFVRDARPYSVPESLDHLEGPDAGVVELPHDVYWGPDRLADLSTRAGREKAYQAVLREGTPVQQIALLHRDALLELWPSLTLPDRVRLLWEARFPELRARDAG